ncbi:MAG TPA: hypothetical protein VD931_20745 [Baekduia sp.]|nr:hypothetical protein [Baekduia sp.]
MTRRLGLPAALLALAGVLLVVFGDSVGVRAAGMLLLGIGGVLLVSLAFLLVGEAEDRERRQAARRGR